MVLSPKRSGRVVAVLRMIQSTSAFFRGLSQHDIAYLGELAETRSIHAGETVVSPEFEPLGFGVVFQGALEALDQHHQRVALIEAGCMFGEASLATGVSAPSAVKAVQATTIVLIRAAVFKQILASKPKVAMHLIQMCATAFSYQVQSVIVGMRGPSLDLLRLLGPSEVRAGGVKMEMMARAQKHTKCFGPVVEEDELQVLADVMHVAEVQEGKLIALRGHRVEHVVFLLQGSMSICEGGNQPSLQLGVLAFGETVGALDMLQSLHAQRAAGVHASDLCGRKHAALGILSFEELKELNNTHPKLVWKLVQRATAGILVQDHKCASLLELSSAAQTQEEAFRETIFAETIERKLNRRMEEVEVGSMLRAFDVEEMSDFLLEEGLDMLMTCASTSHQWRGMRREEMALVAHTMMFAKSPQGSKICCAGEAATFFVLVLQGSMKVDAGLGVWSILHPGDLFGAEPMFTGKPRDADAVMAEGGVVAVCPYSLLLRMHRRQPDVGLKVISLLATSSVRSRMRTAPADEAECADLLRDRDGSKDAHPTVTKMMDAGGTAAALMSWSAEMAVKLCGKMWRKTLSKSEWVTRPWHEAQALVFVMEGSLEVLTVSGTILVGAAQKGDMLGESALLSVGLGPRERRNFSVRAGARGAIVAVLPAQALTEMLHINSKFAAALATFCLRVHSKRLLRALENAVADARFQVCRKESKAAKEAARAEAARLAQEELARTELEVSNEPAEDESAAVPNAADALGGRAGHTNGDADTCDLEEAAVPPSKAVLSASMPAASLAGMLHGGSILNRSMRRLNIVDTLSAGNLYKGGSAHPASSTNTKEDGEPNPQACPEEESAKAPTAVHPAPRAGLHLLSTLVLPETARPLGEDEDALEGEATSQVGMAMVRGFMEAVPQEKVAEAARFPSSADMEEYELEADLSVSNVEPSLGDGQEHEQGLVAEVHKHPPLAGLTGVLSKYRPLCSAKRHGSSSSELSPLPTRLQRRAHHAPTTPDRDASPSPCSSVREFRMSRSHWKQPKGGSQDVHLDAMQQRSMINPKQTQSSLYDSSHSPGQVQLPPLVPSTACSRRPVTAPAAAAMENLVWRDSSQEMVLTKMLVRARIGETSQGAYYSPRRRSVSPVKRLKPSMGARSHQDIANTIHAARLRASKNIVLGHFRFPDRYSNNQ